MATSLPAPVLEHVTAAAPPAAVTAPPAAVATPQPFVLDAVRMVRHDLAKRVLDVLAAGMLLVAVLPVMLLLTLLVATTSRGPVLHRQRRYGHGGTTFELLKFRSMHPDAEARLEQVLAADPALAAEYHERCKLARDPRVTWIGAILRRTSLDELPQLVNVLRGDMSLVGPRPIRDHDLPHYGPDATRVMLQVPPGLTGPWQVSDRARVRMAERVAMDVAYARTRTLATDLRILARTPWAVVRGSGDW